MKYALLVICLALPGFSADLAWSQKESGWVAAIAFSPDASILAEGRSNGKIRFLNAATGSEIRSLKSPRSTVSSIAFSADGQKFAAGSFDQIARVWSVSNGKQTLALRGHRGGIMSVAFSPTGAFIATGGIDAKIFLWNPRTGARVGELDGHKSWVNSLAFDGHGRLYSGGSDGLIHVWDPSEGSLLHTIDATASEIRSIAVTRDGRKIAAGIRYGQVKMWTDFEPAFAVKAHEGDTWAVAFSVAGISLVSGGGDWKKPGDVKLWGLEGEKNLTSIPTVSEILGLALSPDARLIAASGADGSVTVFRAAVID